MTKQTKIVNELRQAFNGVDSFHTTDQTEFGGGVVVTMTLVNEQRQTREINQFVVGPRGGLTTRRQEFTALEII